MCSLHAALPHHACAIDQQEFGLHTPPGCPPLLGAQISPLCPEAHNVLAVLSGSYEAALEHYQRGEEVGLQVRPFSSCQDCLLGKQQLEEFSSITDEGRRWACR